MKKRKNGTKPISSKKSARERASFGPLAPSLDLESRDGLHLKTFPLNYYYYTLVRTLHLLVRYTSVLFYLAIYAIT